MSDSSDDAFMIFDALDHEDAYWEDQLNRENLAPDAE